MGLPYSIFYHVLVFFKVNNKQLHYTKSTLLNIVNNNYKLCKNICYEETIVLAEQNHYVDLNSPRKDTASTEQ